MKYARIKTAKYSVFHAIHYVRVQGVLDFAPYFVKLLFPLDLAQVYHVTCLLSSIILGLLAKKFKVLLLPSYSLDLIQV